MAFKNGMKSSNNVPIIHRIKFVRHVLVIICYNVGRLWANSRFRLITTRLMIWWSVLEFGLEIFISMYTRESHQTYKETPINYFGHKNVKQKPLHLPERIECIYFSDGVEPNEKITSILHFVFFRFADSTLSITFQEEEWRNISKNAKEVSPCSKRSHFFPKSVL